MQFRFVYLSEDSSARAEPLAFFIFAAMQSTENERYVSILFFYAQTILPQSGKPLG